VDLAVIVVDVGCMSHAGDGRYSGTEESVHELIGRFKPQFLYGFDPLLGRSMQRNHRRTKISLKPHAAWLYDGYVKMHVNGIRSGITHDQAKRVKCFDFPEWIETALLGPHEIVLKLDCEGAEYPLLWAIHNRELDKRISLILVEWHEGVQWQGDNPSYGWHVMGRPPLRCPVEQW